MIIAFFALLIGYLGIRQFYTDGLPEGVSEISTLSLCLLVFCGFLTGVGGNGGLVGAMNATAKSFPDKTVRAHFNYRCASVKTRLSYSVPLLTES